MTGYISLDIMLIIMLTISAAFTLLALTHPIFKRLGIVYEEGVIEFGQSDLMLRVLPRIRFERYKKEKDFEITENTIYYY